MQKAPIYHSHIYWQIKISRIVFEKDHPRNISVKLFQNLTSGFGDFLRISSCPYSAKSHHLPEPCLYTDQNFVNNFWKGSPKQHTCEIIPNSDQLYWWRRILKNFFQSIECKVSPPPEAMFFDDQNFTNNFWKGSPKEKSCEFISKSDQQFQRRILKNFSQCKNPSPTAAMFFDDQNFMNNFWKGSPKEKSCEFISKSDQQFQRRILKNFSQCKNPSPNGGHVFRRIKISQTIFEKGYTRNNLVKLFQILTSSFRGEDF